jgi:predicted RNA-binding Zn-ribbon protein involved in translation (DUF1610 family)
MDIMDHGRSIYKCPKCGCELRPPETYYDGEDQLIEGASSYWCPACGWEQDDNS